MLTALPVARSSIEWVDKEGNRALSSMWFPYSITIAEIDAATLSILSTMQGLSNGAVRSIRYQYTREEDAEVTPDVSAKLTRFLALYYRSDDEYAAVHIPSPSPLLFETAGPYAGIRLNMANADVALLVDTFTTAILPALAAEFQAVSWEFLVGGLAL